MKHSVTDLSKESALYSLWCYVLTTLHKYRYKNSSTNARHSFSLNTDITRTSDRSIEIFKYNSALPDIKERWKSKDSFLPFLLFEGLKRRVYQIANFMLHP